MKLVLRGPTDNYQAWLAWASKTTSQTSGFEFIITFFYISHGDIEMYNSAVSQVKYLDIWNPTFNTMRTIMLQMYQYQFLENYHYQPINSDMQAVEHRIWSLLQFSFLWCFLVILVLMHIVTIPKDQCPLKRVHQFTIGIPTTQVIGYDPKRYVMSFQWHHDGRDSVSNNQSHDCLLKHLFGCRSKKTSKLRVTGLCAGNSPGTGEFPTQMASNTENVSIWWHHVGGLMS